MAGTSSRTTLVTIRLPKDTLEVLSRRAAKNNTPVREYLRNRIVYDTGRKHVKGKEIQGP